MLVSEKTWDLEELKNVCPQDVTERAEVYVRALSGKIDRIITLCEKFKKNDEFQFESDAEYFGHVQLETEIYIESLAFNLHTLSDVVAQIINEIVLKGTHVPEKYLTEEQVSMKKVQDKLRNMSGIDLSHQIYIDGLNEHINAFVDSREFSYICAFTNIIKHRRLLDTSYRIEINSSGSILDLGFEMDGFSYKNQSYDRASCRDIVEVYKEKIIDSIFDVGSKINEYCSAIYSES